MDEIVIRPMNLADSEAVGGLCYQLAVYHQMLDANLSVPAPDATKHYIRRLNNQLSDSDTRIFVAEVDSEVVGYIIGVLVDKLPEMFVPERTGYISDVYVHPEYRGKGLGRALVGVIEDWLQSAGVFHYEWYVASRNVEGIAFWQAIGGNNVMIKMRTKINKGNK